MIYLNTPERRGVHGRQTHLKLHMDSNARFAKCTHGATDTQMVRMVLYTVCIWYCAHRAYGIRMVRMMMYTVRMLLHAPCVLHTNGTHCTCTTHHVYGIRIIRNACEPFVFYHTHHLWIVQTWFANNNAIMPILIKTQVIQ